MFLETSRLILRKFREEDFADYAVWRGDEEINRLMGNSLDVRQTFDWLKDHEERSYVLVLKETGRVIGDLTVCTVPADLAALEPLAGKRGVSLSFSISRDFRRRGLMTEALEAVIRRLFEEEGFDYIRGPPGQAGVHPSRHPALPHGAHGVRGGGLPRERPLPDLRTSQKGLIRP